MAQIRGPTPLGRGSGLPDTTTSRSHAAKTQACRVADAQRRVAWSLNAGSAHPPSIGEFTLVVDGPTAQTLSANWFLGLAYAMRHEGVLRRISVGGLPYTSAKTELNRRKLPKPACIAIWVIERPVSSMRRLARCTRTVLASCDGLACRWRANRRLNCRDPIPRRAAKCSTVAPS
jgi:hypothetical protein